MSVVGCRDAEVPSELVLLRRSTEARRAVVACRHSDVTWLVECRNASWVGLDTAAANCSSTQTGNAHVSYTHQSFLFPQTPRRIT